ncbi:MAG: transcription antitermination factor NusB [Eubacteriaceae bacterium]
MSRSYAREVVLKTIFQLDFYEDESKEKYLEHIKRFKLNKLDSEYSVGMITQIYDNKENIDDIINKYLVNWDTKRLNLMELSILRLATYEIIKRKDIPIPVSISEAINFTIKYSEKESVKYINAVLEKVAKGDESIG